MKNRLIDSAWQQLKEMGIDIGLYIKVPHVPGGRQNVADECGEEDEVKEEEVSSEEAHWDSWEAHFAKGDDMCTV